MNKLLLFGLMIIFSSTLFCQYVDGEDSIIVTTEKYYKMADDSLAYIEIEYPVIKTQNKKVEEKINNFLKNEFTVSIEWYESILSSDEERPEHLGKIPYEFNTAYDVKLNTTKIFSVCLNHYEYTGGAHGNFFASCFNINLNTGDQITLQNLLRRNSLNELSEIVSDKILEMFEAETLVEAGLFDDVLIIEWDQDFYLTPNSLVVQFDPYEIAPYYMGDIEVELPYDEIFELFENSPPF